MQKIGHVVSLKKNSQFNKKCNPYLNEKKRDVVGTIKLFYSQAFYEPVGDSCLLLPVVPVQVEKKYRYKYRLRSVFSGSTSMYVLFVFELS